MVMDTEEQIIVANGVVERIEKGPPTQVELSNGVVLNIRRVPPLAFREAALSVPRPKVPVQVLEDGREVENPNHPDYLEAVSRFEIDQQSVAANVLFMIGTTFERAPEGFPKPEDDDWLEELEDIGVKADIGTRRKRYLAWLRFRALESVDDIRNLSTAITRASGIQEEEVADAALAFRDNA